MEINMFDIQAGARSLPYDKENDHYKPTFNLNYDFSSIIPQAKQSTTTIAKNTSVFLTVAYMKRIVRKYSHQVKALAEVLKSNLGLEQDAYNIWRFIKERINYKLDRPGHEELRTPARVWRNKITGVDCDDYAIMAACLLKEMGHGEVTKFRMVRFNGKENYSHIYVMAGKYPLDPVIQLFNIEPEGLDESPSAKKDYPIMTNTNNIGCVNNPNCGCNKTSMSGVEDVINGLGAALPASPRTKKILERCLGETDAATLALLQTGALLNGTDEQIGYLAAAEFAVPSKDKRKVLYIPRRHQRCAGFIAGLSMALDALNVFIKQNGTTPALDAIKAKLEKAISDIRQKRLRMRGGRRYIQGIGEIELSGEIDAVENVTSLGEIADGLSQIDLYGDESDLSGKKSRAQRRKERRERRKRRWRNFKHKVKAFGKKIGQAVKKALKNPLHALNRINPLLIVGRGAFIGLMRLNFANMAFKLFPLYATPEQYKKLGFGPTKIANLAKGRKKLENVWDKLGGKADKLRKAVLAGSKKKRRKAGLGYVNEDFSGYIDGLGAIGVINLAKASKDAKALENLTLDKFFAVAQNVINNPSIALKNAKNEIEGIGLVLYGQDEIFAGQDDIFSGLANIDYGLGMEPASAALIASAATITAAIAPVVVGVMKMIKKKEGDDGDKADKVLDVIDESANAIKTTTENLPGAQSQESGNEESGGEQEQEDSGEGVEGFDGDERDAMLEALGRLSRAQRKKRKKARRAKRKAKRAARKSKRQAKRQARKEKRASRRSERSGGDAGEYIDAGTSAASSYESGASSASSGEDYDEGGGETEAGDEGGGGGKKSYKGGGVRDFLRSKVLKAFADKNLDKAENLLQRTLLNPQMPGSQMPTALPYQTTAEQPPQKTGGIMDSLKQVPMPIWLALGIGGGYLLFKKR